MTNDEIENMSSTPPAPSPPLDSSFTDRQAEELIEVDRVLRALAHPRRREVLGLLDEQSRWTGDQLAAYLVDTEGRAGGRSEQEVRTALLHKHLPRLEGAELIAFDSDSGLVRRGESFDVVREMADAASSVTPTR